MRCLLVFNVILIFTILACVKCETKDNPKDSGALSDYEVYPGPKQEKHNFFQKLGHHLKKGWHGFKSLFGRRANRRYDNSYKEVAYGGQGKGEYPEEAEFGGKFPNKGYQHEIKPEYGFGEAKKHSGEFEKTIGINKKVEVYSGVDKHFKEVSPHKKEEKNLEKYKESYETYGPDEFNKKEFEKKPGAHGGEYQPEIEEVKVGKEVPNKGYQPEHGFGENKKYSGEFGKNVGKQVEVYSGIDERFKGSAPGKKEEEKGGYEENFETYRSTGANKKLGKKPGAYGEYQPETDEVKYGKIRGKRNIFRSRRHGGRRHGSRRGRFFRGALKVGTFIGPKLIRG